MEVDVQPQPAEIDAETHWALLAKKHWPKHVTTRKIKNDLIKSDIWDVLEQENFAYRSLLILESLQLLEK